MLSRIKVLSMVVVLGVGTSVAMAGTPGLNHREHHQLQRIHQGVGSGELTRPETHRLLRGEAHLRHMQARAKSDGTVTPAERARLQAAANTESKRIYRQKHDAQTRGN